MSCPRNAARASKLLEQLKSCTDDEKAASIRAELVAIIVDRASVPARQG